MEGARRTAFIESLRGTRIGGRYVVEKLLGKGGMGLVMSARYPELDQRVAVKFLLPEFAEHPQLSARFLREAKIAATVESPHLCRVFDVGRLDEGIPYMVMELLSGKDLGDELHEKGQLPIDSVVDLMLQACVGTAQLHAHGIIHRDLKPSNLFLSLGRGGARTVKVLDFGISKQSSTTTNDSSNLTATEHLLGTPQYMSPEQIKDAKRADARADIWSLGVILYESLTGQSPFKQEGSGVGELFGLIMFTDPTAPSHYRADIPGDLEQVVLKCLKREPSERFATVGELATALAPFAGGSAHRVDEVRRALASLRPSAPAAEVVVAQRLAGSTEVGGIGPPPSSGKPTQIGRTPELETPEVLAVRETVLATSNADKAALGAMMVTRAEPQAIAASQVDASTPAASTSTADELRLPLRGRGVVRPLIGAAVVVIAGALVFVLRADPKPAISGVASVSAVSAMTAPPVAASPAPRSAGSESAAPSASGVVGAATAPSAVPTTPEAPVVRPNTVAPPPKRTAAQPTPPPPIPTPTASGPVARDRGI